MKNVFIIIRINPTSPSEQQFIDYVEGDVEAVEAYVANPTGFITWLRNNGWKPALLPEPISITHERITYSKA
ncbi:MAG: hypothetical protein OHK0046_44310 [Anaerolineae bacterium]